MIKLIKFFTGVDIQFLENEIHRLNNRLTKVENPFKFDIGDKFQKDLYSIGRSTYIVTEKNYKYYECPNTGKKIVLGKKQYTLTDTNNGESIYMDELSIEKWHKV